MEKWQGCSSYLLGFEFSVFGIFSGSFFAWSLKPMVVFLGFQIFETSLKDKKKSVIYILNARICLILCCIHISRHFLTLLKRRQVPIKFWYHVCLWDLNSQNDKLTEKSQTSGINMVCVCYLLLKEANIHINLVLCNRDFDHPHINVKSVHFGLVYS